MKCPESSPFPDTLYTARTCREIDRRVIESGRASGFALMTRAGEFACRCLRDRFPCATRISIVCGSGNNGGDGYIVAALAAAGGLDARVYALAEPGTEDSRAARNQAEGQGASIIVVDKDQDLPGEAVQADVIVDAVLGTGVDRDIEGRLARAIRVINESGLPVLACDMPTGLHSDTGRIMGCAVVADVTVTFIALKAGLFTGQGKAVSGNVCYTDLDLGQACLADQPGCAQLLTLKSMAGLARPRSESAHKGISGYAAVIGGGPDMLGAAVLAGKAAYRAGCGRVRVFTLPAHAGQVALACPELLSRGTCGETGLTPDLESMDVIAIGPGLGLGEWSQDLFVQALQCRCPLVIDADALTLLAADPDKADNRVLTPHPGEAARLLDCSVSEVESDRFAAAREISASYGGVCLLKGSGTVVASEGQIPRVCRDGNAGQATAGMGDILTGVIAGLIAQGYPLFDAACLGTWLHACAADRVAEDSGRVGMMASDLLPHVQRMHNCLIDGDRRGHGGL